METLSIYKKILKVEQYIRCNENPEIKFDELLLDDYWNDIIRLLLIFNIIKIIKRLTELIILVRKLNQPYIKLILI